jgi:hypothetical protein
MGNIYYNPEDHGLEIVAEIDFADSYDFDKIVVWKSKDENKFFWAQDSGCSCPSPFEDYHSVDALEVLNDHTFCNLENAIKGEEYSYRYHGNVAGKEQFLREVEKVCRDK